MPLAPRAGSNDWANKILHPVWLKVVTVRIHPASNQPPGILPHKKRDFEHSFYISQSN
jgi:hypothetical protein